MSKVETKTLYKFQKLYTIMHFLRR